ncbi:MAG: phosphatidylglycerophosphatase A [Alphaproteobacteria bacterium]|nr:phosphatidylglycerophosphatase A [Alphaproteobacteria bacterium]
MRKLPPLSFILATGFGLGLLRPMPGTWGSLGTLPLGYALSVAYGPTGLACAAIIVLLLGLWASGQVVMRSGVKDDPRIVIDEIAGQFLALIPAGQDLQLIFFAFLFFRFFDITKPWPARRIDRHWPGALGVMVDDIVAGIYAALLLMGVHLAGFG